MQDAVHDEIDLIELVETLWDAKWLIMAITSGFAALSILLALSLPPSFEGKLRISALTNQQMAAYQTLNNTPGISAPIYAGEILVGQTGVVLKNELFAAFENELLQGSIFGTAHKSFDPDIMNFDGSRQELVQKLAKIGHSYQFSRDKGSNNSGVLTFTTRDRDLALRIVDLALAAATNDIRIDNLAAIANLSRSIENSLEFELDEVTSAINGAVADYQVKTNARRALLKEHAAIARQLGIADYQPGAAAQVGIDISIENDASQVSQGRGLLYLRGFKALEKEIQLIEARGDDASAYPFINNYAALAAQKHKLENDKRLDRIATGLALTPLADKTEFRAVNFDLSTVVFENTTNKPLIVILATLMGGIIAVIFVLIRGAMVARQKQTAA